MLSEVGGLLGRVGTIVRSCHERWDGAGYPDGLAGEEIPLVARIVFCCDAFHAMTTDRSYRAARSPERALAELQAHAGSQFDPTVVDVLTRRVTAGRAAASSERRSGRAPGSTAASSAPGTPSRRPSRATKASSDCVRTGRSTP